MKKSLAVLFVLTLFNVACDVKPAPKSLGNELGLESPLSGTVLKRSFQLLHQLFRL